jgi:1-acyl-sn-glycerol-3-phosphate acyltransferase
MTDLPAAAAALGVVAFARTVTGVRANWRGCTPSSARRIYIANHVSHGDFVLIWTVLPRPLRASTRPVAALDYWTAGALRRFFGQRVFRALLIDRAPVSRASNPVATMMGALETDSLILFPEGTRNTGAAPLLPFRSGLFHLARAKPETEIVPVWIDNLSRVMPKGEMIPVPLLCTVTFGEPFTLRPGEDRSAFLARAEAAVLALRPAPPAAGVEVPA